MDRGGVEAHKHVKKKEQGQYPAILTKQAWSVKDLFFGMKHQKVILIVLVYLHVLKGKPVACKNQWCMYLYLDWVNVEIQSFDWFTFLTSKYLTSEWSLQMYKTTQTLQSSF